MGNPDSSDSDDDTAIGAAVGTATPSKKSPLTQEEKKDEKRES